VPAPVVAPTQLRFEATAPVSGPDGTVLAQGRLGDQVVPLTWTVLLRQDEAIGAGAPFGTVLNDAGAPLQVSKAGTCRGPDYNGLFSAFGRTWLFTHLECTPAGLVLTPTIAGALAVVVVIVLVVALKGNGGNKTTVLAATATVTASASAPPTADPTTDPTAPTTTPPLGGGGDTPPLGGGTPTPPPGGGGGTVVKPKASTAPTVKPPTPGLNESPMCKNAKASGNASMIKKFCGK